MAMFSKDDGSWIGGFVNCAAWIISLILTFWIGTHHQIIFLQEGGFTVKRRTDVIPQPDQPYRRGRYDQDQ